MSRKEEDYWKDMCRKLCSVNGDLRKRVDEAVRLEAKAVEVQRTAEAVVDGLEWAVTELTEENAKLRELVMALDRCNENFGSPHGCARCRLEQSNASAPLYAVPACVAMMRDLGIEVG